MRTDGVTGWQAYDSAVNGERFLKFVETKLGVTSRPGNVTVQEPGSSFRAAEASSLGFRLSTTNGKGVSLDGATSGYGQCSLYEPVATLRGRCETGLTLHHQRLQVALGEVVRGLDVLAFRQQPH